MDVPELRARALCSPPRARPAAGWAAAPDRTSARPRTSRSTYRYRYDRIRSYVCLFPNRGMNLFLNGERPGRLLCFDLRALVRRAPATRPPSLGLCLCFARSPAYRPLRVCTLPRVVSAVSPVGFWRCVCPGVKETVLGNLLPHTYENLLLLGVLLPYSSSTSLLPPALSSTFQPSNPDTQRH